MKPFVELRNIKKKFGRVEALRGIDLQIHTGRVLALVGDNGAGKSTIIKILSGALEPDSGEIWIEDTCYSKLKPKTAIKAGISTAYQDLALVNTLDITDNIFLGREKIRGGFLLDRNAMRMEAETLLQELEIQIPFIEAAAEHLSGGQRQGLAVARAVHQGGRLLIFDEPTAAMGLKETAGVLRLIQRLAEKGYGVVVVSHNMEQVFEISQEICVMRHGAVAGLMQTSEVTPRHVVEMITGAVGKVEADES